MHGGLTGTTGWRLSEDTVTVDAVLLGLVVSLGLTVVVGLLTLLLPLTATASLLRTPADALAEPGRAPAGALR